MNTTFSLQRVKLLLMRYFVENWKNNLYIGLSIFLLSSLININNTTLLIYFTLVLFFSGSIYDVNLSSIQKIHYLMIPTNTFEKFLVNAILVHIYYPLILLLFIVLGLVFREIIDSFLFDNAWDLSMNLFELFKTIFSANLLIIIVIQSLFMFGSVYFTKLSMFKTFFFVIIFILIQSCVFFITLFSNLKVLDNFVIQKLCFRDRFFNHSDIYISIFFICFFWVLSYIRLRETEV